jgi:hypothetical protein
MVEFRLHPGSSSVISLRLITRNRGVTSRHSAARKFSCVLARGPSMVVISSSYEEPPEAGERPHRIWLQRGAVVFT